MTPVEFRELLAYNRWANHALLDLVAELGDEELTRPLGNSFPSIRDTLVHTLSSEWLWSERWQGRSPQFRLDPTEFPTVDALRQRWSEVEAVQDDYATDLTQELIDGEFSYLNPKGERWTYVNRQCLHQLWTHSLYHRGQVVTMLRQLGKLPAETDILTFFDVAGGPAPRAH
ncbi:MAG: DinB family protein [Acidobacteriota bacterium]